MDCNGRNRSVIVGFAMSSPTEQRPRKTTFPDTNWAEVNAVADGDSRARDQVISRYREPMLAFLRCTGFAREEAEDALHDFLAFAIKRELFARGEQSRGRFRSFLLAALKNFLANRRRHAHAARRHPAGGLGSLDEMADEYCQPEGAIESETPERAFDRAWTRELMVRVLARLESECRERGQSSHFEVFRLRIIGPQLDGNATPAMDAVARRLGLTFKETANRLVTMKRAFRRVLRAELGNASGSSRWAAHDEREALGVLGLST